jgi:D-serine deaminase-like pyridoxal phosphate-dependent protein
MRLEQLPTPALVLDLDRLERNCRRMQERAADLGVRLRPHLKTAKSADVARVAAADHSSGITVSTLAEVEHFAMAGFRDITYAVGIAADKLAALTGVQRRHGVTVRLLADSVAAIEVLSDKCASLGERFSVFIEIDCGAGRGGMLAESPELPRIAQAIEVASFLSLAGVLTHAGHSYAARCVDAIEQIAEAERESVVRAAERLRSEGFAVPFVSIGSTPTAVFAKSLGGVTDMRPGVYMLFDLAQVALGTCSVDDVAVSVLATVVGENPRSFRTLIDAGALALSSDLSANRHGCDIRYGLVSPLDGGKPFDGVHIAEVHQEHGFVKGAFGCGYRVGTKLRVQPNHACMTAAPYDRYYVVRGQDTRILHVWPKVRGWLPVGL